MPIHPADRPHGRNPAIFDGPCDCDECQAWHVEEKRLDDEYDAQQERDTERKMLHGCD